MLSGYVPQLSPELVNIAFIEDHHPDGTAFVKQCSTGAAVFNVPLSAMKVFPNHDDFNI